MKKKKKLLWIPVVAVILAVAILVGIFVRPGKSKAPVYVYRISDGLVGMTDYYEGGTESYGMVTTDRVQPVYLTNTQTVTDVKVTEGQTVKKGDVLITYDTTLSELQLERQDLSIQQMKINLKNAQKELNVIKSYKPISVRPTKPTSKPTTKPSDGPDFDATGKDHLILGGNGTSRTKPKYCWLHSNTQVDESIIEEMFTGVKSNSVFVVFQNTEDDKGNTEFTDSYGVKFTRTPVAPDPTEPSTDPTEPPTEPATEPPTEPPTEEPTEPETQPETGGESTEGSSASAPRTTGEKTTKYTYSMSFFVPPADVVIDEPDEPDDGGVDWNSGYTSSEIASMRKEKEEEIDRLNFDIKMAQAEYNIMKKEADDGKVTAQFAGVVVGITDPEEARANNVPLLRVSGGGGFYVEGSVGELSMDTVQVGQEVQITSWDTWETYTGTVTEIGQYPVESDGYYSGTNESYYPYKVFIDESANLQDGSYVSMVPQTGAGDDSQTGTGLYLNNAFLVKEGAESFVYVRGEDGLLEKRQVQTGRSLPWGDQTEIRSGLTGEDAVAFPYGKEVKVGAPTVDGDYSTLYGDY